MLSVAQLGTRLHVLLDPATDEPAARTLRLLRDAAVVASTELVRASLEDVFVAATGFGRPQRPARAGRG